MKYAFIQRHLSDDALLVHIKAIHAQTRGGYGWPRTWRELLARGIRVGMERVQKLMKLHGIRAKERRRFKVTTDSNHDLPIAPNLLDRQFTVAQPDKVWAGDITCKQAGLILHSDRGSASRPGATRMPINLGKPVHERLRDTDSRGKVNRDYLVDHVALAGASGWISSWQG